MLRAKKLVNVTDAIFEMNLFWMATISLKRSSILRSEVNRSQEPRNGFKV